MLNNLYRRRIGHWRPRQKTLIATAKLTFSCHFLHKNGPIENCRGLQLILVGKNSVSVLRYFLEVGYHGGRYHGWQAHPNGSLPTVQAELDKCLGFVLRHPVSTVGSGRTDTGVHCVSQFAHFDTDAAPLDEGRFLYRLNQCLPPDISARSLRAVSPDAHARFSATSRRYEYQITQQKNPLRQGLAYYYPRPLDLAAMNTAASEMLECYDFQSLSLVKTQVKTFLCRIGHAYWEQQGADLTFHIRADRFLRGMVRATVGTLLDVGRGQLTPQGFANILRSKDRRQAGRAVPAHGLYLAAVSYPAGLFLPPSRQNITY
jgi:tRNA pseudouridine38-40 synthase